MDLVSNFYHLDFQLEHTIFAVLCHKRSHNILIRYCSYLFSFLFILWGFHLLYFFYHIHSPSLTPPRTPYLPIHSSLCDLSFPLHCKKIPWSPVCVGWLLRDVGPALECGLYTTCHSFKGTNFPSFSSNQTSIAARLGVANSPPPGLDFIRLELV